MSVFLDLNLPFSPKDEENLGKLKKLSEMGYKAIAWTFSFDAKLMEPAPKEKLQKLRDLFPAIKQYSRITVRIDNPSQNFKLNENNPIIRSYDILAFMPLTEKAFVQLCTNMSVDFDIMTFPSTERLPFVLKHSLLGSVISRGIMVEICYSDFLSSDSYAKKISLSIAMNVIRSSRFRGVICCSGAKSEMNFRYPNDIVNLGHILGFKDVAKSRDCITLNAKSVLLHALARLKSFKSVVLDPKDLDDFHVGESFISI